MKNQKVNEVEVYETLFNDKETLKRIRQIRARATYSFWRFQYDALKHQGYTTKQIESLLRWCHTIVNNKYGYRSASGAGYSEESLNQVVKDKRSGMLK